ncbi:MAG: hypothetical protein LLG04_02890 [Parachlamydia sp.]|nr:hypothetical protein [Parachlamydia sp.]
MKAAEKGLDQQISLWPLVGPLLLLASLTLLFWNVPERALVFGGIAALSLALSWRLTWKGVAISMGLLALGFWYHAGSMDLKETLWHLGMSLALTLGFAATALSREETAERLLQLFPEPSVKNEELERLTKQLADQKSSAKLLEEQAQTSREAFAQQHDRVLSLEQLLDVAREEIKTAMDEREQLQREVLQRKDSAARSLEQMAEAKEEARYLAEELKVQKAGETAALTELKTLLEQRDHQQKLLQADLEKIHQDIRSSKAQAEGQAKRAAFLEEEKQAMLRTWERERSEAQQMTDAGTAQLKSQLAAAEEQARRTVALEEEKQTLLRSWERERQDADQLKSRLDGLQQKLAAAEEQLHKASASMECERSEALLQMEHLQKMLANSEEKASRVASLESEMLTLQAEAQRQTAALQGQIESLLKNEEARHQQQQEIEAKIGEYKVQVELLQQNMAVAEVQKIAHWRAMRTAEGKHQQLREQFEEKAAQLNDARRERFLADENAERLARELEELAQYGRLYPEKPLTKHMARIEREYAASVALLEREIESLHSLIGHFFKGQT